MERTFRIESADPIVAQELVDFLQEFGIPAYIAETTDKDSIIKVVEPEHGESSTVRRIRAWIERRGNV